MLAPIRYIVAYPLLTLNCYSTQPITKDIIVPYKPYTTTSMIQDQDIKVYESFWNNMIKEAYEDEKNNYKD